jgi:hypothetical protein
MGSNPVADVGKVDESCDVRRERRALTADELRALLDAAPEHTIASVTRFSWEPDFVAESYWGCGGAMCG